MPRYADIVLPLAQPAYTFAVPDGLSLAEGQAVAVQFGGGQRNAAGGPLPKDGEEAFAAVRTALCRMLRG